jgi:hypothetical protein
MNNRFFIEGVTSPISNMGQSKKSDHLLNEIRKKNISVEPPEMGELEYRTHIQKKQSNLAKN